MSARNRRLASHPRAPADSGRMPESDIRELKRPSRVKLKLPRDPDAYDPSEAASTGKRSGNESRGKHSRNKSNGAGKAGKTGWRSTYARTWDYEAFAGDVEPAGRNGDGVSKEGRSSPIDDTSGDGLDEVMSYDSELAIPMETESGFGDPYDHILTEPGLARRPEDFGLQFLRNATQQDNFESMMATEEERALDQELFTPSFSDESLFDDAEDEESDEEAGDQPADVPNQERYSGVRARRGAPRSKQR